MKPNHNDVKVFDNGLKMTRSNKFQIEDIKDESPFASFWSWKAHLAVFFVYGGIATALIYSGHSGSGWALMGVMIIVNSAWIVFKGVPMFFRWLVNLVKI